MAAARSESKQTYSLRCFAFEMRELFLKLRGIMELLLSGFAAIQLVMLSAGCELWVSAVATVMVSLPG
jgi:hypothetical protein